eukprot:TRINITY_DN15076_c0_g1_i1.p1 TRINITY_DN15076_c0_g1~~TRINITY_DN15076_c0_g1_i1.p1  ORF type:complete len:569 (+),score=-32.61 TRINITY_DN15076_c0_g1_i1:73-1779(+)
MPFARFGNEEDDVEVLNSKVIKVAATNTVLKVGLSDVQTRVGQAEATLVGLSGVDARVSQSEATIVGRGRRVDGVESSVADVNTRIPLPLVLQSSLPAGAVIDFDAYTSSGVYHIFSPVPTIVNDPPNASLGSFEIILEVRRFNADYIQQDASGMFSRTRFTRMRSTKLANGFVGPAFWSEWREYGFTDNVDAKDGVVRSDLTALMDVKDGAVRGDLTLLMDNKDGVVKTDLTNIINYKDGAVRGDLTVLMDNKDGAVRGDLTALMDTKDGVVKTDLTNTINYKDGAVRGDLTVLMDNKDGAVRGDLSALMDVKDGAVRGDHTSLMDNKDGVVRSDLSSLMDTKDGVVKTDLTSLMDSKDAALQSTIEAKIALPLDTSNANLPDGSTIDFNAFVSSGIYKIHSRGPSFINAPRGPPISWEVMLSVIVFNGEYIKQDLMSMFTKQTFYRMRSPIDAAKPWSDWKEYGEKEEELRWVASPDAFDFNTETNQKEIFVAAFNLNPFSNHPSSFLNDDGICILTNKKYTNPLNVTQTWIMQELRSPYSNKVWTRAYIPSPLSEWRSWKLMNSS